MDELVQYFIVNKELNMSAGKMAAQVAHVATMIAVHNTSDLEDNNLDYWLRFGSDQKKIILQGKQKDLERLSDQFYHIRDNGLTENPKDSLTVVGLPPMRRSEAKKHIKRLQLYKD